MSSQLYASAYKESGGGSLSAEVKNQFYLNNPLATISMYLVSVDGTSDKDTYLVIEEEKATSKSEITRFFLKANTSFSKLFIDDAYLTEQGCSIVGTILDSDVSCNLSFSCRYK